MTPTPAPGAINISLDTFRCQYADRCPLSGSLMRSENNILRQTNTLQQYPLLPDMEVSACNIVGIPTLEGIEFLKTEEIIRCEGLQRLTKVFTTGATIISSYNIGEFGKLLCSSGFFAPHKSHLINLQYLRRYNVDGTISLRDGACVPLARRRKEAFLKWVRHL
jgi:DNA-binding LytR/AlgR family response regulator